MSDPIEEYFTATTAEDQADNYFFGERKEGRPRLSDDTEARPGTYRVIDGTICRVISGLPLEEVRRRLLQDR